MEKQGRILCISSNRAKEILASCDDGETHTPKGKYLLRECGKYIGIDNEDGCAWTEEFDTLAECIAWLKGDAEPFRVYCPNCHTGATFRAWNNAEGTNPRPLNLQHEIENDDEDIDVWVHCPICSALVAVHMIIEENQDRIGWMEWEQEPDMSEKDIVAGLEFSGYEPDPVTGVLDAENAPESPFEKMLGERSRDVVHFSRFLDSLPAEYFFLRRVLDGLDIYIRDGIDQDEPLGIVETIKTQAEAIRDLRTALHGKEQQRAVAFGYVTKSTQLTNEVVTLQASIRDLQKNISKRDQKIAELENLRATDRAEITRLMEEVGSLSCINSDLGEGIRKAEAEAKEARKSLTVIENYIQSLKDGYGKGKQ